MTDINIKINIEFINNNTNINPELIKPIIKWVGGKGQILDQIVPKIPTEINNYYEPFVGGGAVFLEVLKRLYNKQIKVNGGFYINDINNDLMNMYSLIKSDVNYLINELEKLNNLYNSFPVIEYPKRTKFIIDLSKPISTLSNQGKEFLYYFLREKYNKLEINSPERVPLFIFLNKTSFRGVYRIGKNGFNVPFGHYNKVTIYNKVHLETLNILFNTFNINISSNTYTNYINNHIFNYKDFVYIDPPYYPIKETSFVDYNIDGFNKEDNDNILKICDTLNNKNVKFLHSNSNCQYNLNSYKNYNISTIVTKRRIHCINPQLTHYELLINN